MGRLSAVQFCSIIFGSSSLIAAAVVLFLTGACYGTTPSPAVPLISSWFCINHLPVLLKWILGRFALSGDITHLRFITLTSVV
jgi:hypothetical protein